MAAIEVREIELLDSTLHASGHLADDLWALLRCGGVPVGYAHLRPQRLRSGALPFGEVVARSLTPMHADHALRVAFDTWVRRSGTPAGFSVKEGLDALREAGARPRFDDVPASAPRISVAICSRDRSQLLARAVESIVSTLGSADELLVVLNAPSDVAGSFDRDRFPSVRVVVEHRPGLSWARNRAIAEFQGDVLLFTDDDCVPNEHWVAAHRSLFTRNPDVDVVTGTVEPLVMDSPAQQLFEAYGGFPRHYARRWMSRPDRGPVAQQVGDLGVGANLGIRRRVFDGIGHFDAALGPGTECSAGDDTEYLFRALKSGLLIACEPRASVRHEHRRDMDGLRSQIGGWSRGFSCAMWRSTVAFPDERRAFGAFRRSVAVAHHAWRALCSPRLRELAMLELWEMRRPSSRYASARAVAVELASEHASPAQDMPPAPVNTTSVRDSAAPIEDLALGLTDFGTPLVLAERVRHAYCKVVVGSKHVGQERLRVFHGVIGADRMLDAMSETLVGYVGYGKWNRAVAASLEYLRASMRAGV